MGEISLDDGLRASSGSPAQRLRGLAADALDRCRAATKELDAKEREGWRLFFNTLLFFQ